MRTYALWDNSRGILAVLSLTAIVTIGAELYSGTIAAMGILGGYYDLCLRGCWLIDDNLALPPIPALSNISTFPGCLVFETNVLIWFTYLSLIVYEAGGLLSDHGSDNDKLT